MGKKRKELTHEEIWDDAGLIESWNASYEEYKLYHSIHARGENVEEALAAFEREQETSDQTNGDVIANASDDAAARSQLANNTAGDVPEGGVGNGVSTNDVGMRIQGQNGSSPIPAHGELSGNTEQAAAAPGPNGAAAAGAHPGPGSGMVERLAAQSSQDPALKNLMMSWYWAGYYTGLHEGQTSGTSQ